MAAVLNSNSFSRLLISLDEDRESAGVKYEDLRRTLIRFFEWRGAPFPEDHTDDVFDRIARRLGEGVEIKNIRGYSHEVARLVFLETLKRADSRQVPFDDLNQKDLISDTVDGNSEKEMRLSCLDECLSGLSADNRELIVDYYQDEKRDRIDRRKALAKRLGIHREAVANRAQRLREKLENCVSGCFRKKTTI